MTTNYSLSDILPKDATGQPMFSPINIATSQLDFALQAGIAPSTVNAKNYVYQGIATHTQSGSMTTAGPGVAVMGYSGTNPFPVATNLQLLWLNSSGALNTVPAESYTLISSGSTAASADTAHRLYGTYNGLSTLNSSVVLYVSAMAETNGAALFFSNAKTGKGIVLSTSAAGYTELKPAQQSAAVDIHFANRVNGSNTTVNWFVYRRD